MKVEIRCPDCDSGYLVDAEAAEAGLPCLGCGRLLQGEAFGHTGAAESRKMPAPLTGVGQPGTAALDTAASATAVAEAAPSAHAPQRSANAIVCPRCKLHFKPRAETQAVARRDATRPTVLIVEDMVYFREIASEALADEYEVKAAATKAEALETIRHGGIDLMVLDLTLDSGEGGLELLRELGAKPCPVLIYTAQDESEMYGDSWDELSALGADDIVLKGMNVGDELKRKVGTLLGHETDDDD